MKKVNLSLFDNRHYRPGGRLKIILWYFANHLFFNTFLPFPSGFRAALLRLFGAKIGQNVVIKPNVNIKYPWFLSIGDHCWIGEGVWIDNLAQVSIGNNVCLSQSSYLLCGNHDYKKESFDLIVQGIFLEEGVWIGAKAVVCPGVKCESHSILSVGSVAIKDMEAYGIYQGNPAILKRKRNIQ